MKATAVSVRLRIYLFALTNTNNLLPGVHLGAARRDLALPTLAEGARSSGHLGCRALKNLLCHWMSAVLVARCLQSIE